MAVSEHRFFEGYSNDGQDLENRSHTGFSRLDEILKGMSAGNLIILAARPKLGKTAFALSIAENIAKSGKTVAFLFARDGKFRDLRTAAL